MRRIRLTMVLLAALAAAHAAIGAPVNGKTPRDMKLLVIGIDGSEPSYQAITYFLDYLGIPYQAVLAKSQPLPALSNVSKGFYQGVILSTGNLGYCDASGCRSALPDSAWASLDAYTRDFGVRMAAFYAWPEKRYGLVATGSTGSSDSAPQSATFTTAGKAIFSYLNTANPLKVTNSWVYLAAPAPDAGETTTPLLTIQGATVAAVHTKADGREYLAMTLDSNPYLLHAMALNYGVFNWVTKGIFIGARKVYLSTQMDDFFLPNDLYLQGVANCTPVGFVTEPTSNASDNCPTARMSSEDLSALLRFQAALNVQTQFHGIRFGLVFNGLGSALGGGDYGAGDPLTVGAQAAKASFYWVNHTFDHENLDCFNPVPNSGICAPANYSQSLQEIQQNVSIARALGLPLDTASMVTPGISGLYNPNFLKAAADSGIRYLVSDTSRPDGTPALPNTGIRSTIQPSILFIPRRATNAFYNTKSGFSGVAGSLPDEYNYFYGPTGLFRIGGPGGQPFFPINQTYADIVNRESDALLTYMMRYEIYPTMWHQSNFVRYAGDQTLFTDIVSATLDKFAKLSNLPVISLQEAQIGKELEDRMAFNSAKVTATLTPGWSITLGSNAAVSVPVTGLCKTNCSSYGGQVISKLPVPARGTITVPLF